MGKLNIMMGIPGAGKSYWCKNNLKAGDVYISRDKIRFKMVSENEQYFSKENQVYNEFIRQINIALEKGNTVYADATHISESSRLKLLNKLTNIDEKNIIYIKVPLELAFAQNEQRKGRAKVPKSVIENMFNSIEEPKKEDYDNIYIIEREV